MPDATAIAVNPGWTATATIGAVQVIATVLLGGGGLYGIARGVALLWKMANDRARQDNDAAAAVRKEMMDLTDRLQKRVDDLEKEGRDERKRHTEEMEALRRFHADELIAARKQYDEEVRGMRAEIAGLHRQMLQMQQTSKAAIALGPRAPTSTAKRMEDSGMEDILGQVYNIPSVGDDAG